MKKSLLRCTLAFSGLLMIAPTFAHDPAEHAKAGEAPNCESMKTMDHSKMDMNDPVMQAMMKKCGGVHDHSASSADHNMEGMNHGNMEGMDHENTEGMDHSKPASSASHEGHGAH